MPIFARFTAVCCVSLFSKVTACVSPGVASARAAGAAAASSMHTHSANASFRFIVLRSILIPSMMKKSLRIYGIILSRFTRLCNR